MVYLFLIENFEETEAVATADLLARAEIPHKLVSLTDELLVKGSRGIRVMADILFAGSELEDIDALIFPGGAGASNYIGNEALVGLTKKHAGVGGVVAAICIAPLFLDKIGVLDGKKAVCYTSSSAALAEKYVGERVVVSGNVITSAGPATVFDFGLAIIEKLKGAASADEVVDGLLFRHFS